MTVDLSEKAWQDQVVQLATMLGWRHLHVRRSIGKGRQWVTATNLAGWPDLLLWRPGRIIAVELKSETGKATGEQVEVLSSLVAAGCEAFIWRPSDFDEVQRVLTAKVTAWP